MVTDYSAGGINVPSYDQITIEFGERVGLPDKARPERLPIVAAPLSNTIT
jgi:hypothetical protein